MTVKEHPLVKREAAALADPPAERTITIVIHSDRYQIEIEIYEPEEE